MPDYTITIRMRGEDNLSATVKTVSGSVNKLGDDAQNAANKSSGLKDALGKFKQELLGIGTAFGLMKFGQMIGDLNEIGMKANAAENTFTSLSGGATQAASNLALMRNATRGVVDDMTLMAGANRLLLMGLASTGEEAASLASGAVALGKAMGMDAAQSVESFAALLANRSIPRLDNFGISAANVRVRIDELKSAGYGIEEAFNMAVLAEMDVSMGKLGDSLDANATAFERWGTRIQNAIQDAGQQVAAGLEGIALAAEVITGQDAGHQHLRNVAHEQALAYTDAFIASMGSELTGRDNVTAFLEDAFYQRMTGNTLRGQDAMKTSAGFDLFGQGGFGTVENIDSVLSGMYAIQDAYDAIEAGKQTAIEQAAAVEIIGNALDSAGLQYTRFQQIGGMALDTLLGKYDEQRQGAEAFEWLKGTANSVLSNIAHMETGWSRMGDNVQDYLAKQRGIEMIGGVIDGAALQYTRFQQIGGTAFQTLINMGQEWQSAQNSYAKTMSGLSGNAASTLSQFGIDPESLFSMSRDVELPEFMRPETAESIAQQYAIVEQQWQSMSELNQQGLITDAELARLTTFKDNMANINSQAQQAAQALNSLADITGQTSGGILGELGSIVMAQAGGSDMGEDLMAQLQREINLASGAETASSVALEEQAAPLILAIAQQVGPKAAAEALQALQSNLEEATYQGLSQEQIAAMIPQYTGYTMGAGGMVSQIPQMMASAMGGAMLDPGGMGGTPGEGAMSASAEMAAMEEKLPIVGELMLPVKESSGQIAADFTTMKTSLTDSISGAEELRHTLDGMGEERTLRVRIEAIDPSGILALAGSAGASLGQSVRDNGGRVPGVDARIPQ